MDFDLSDDQQLLMTALDGLLDPYRQPPADSLHYTAYSAALQEELVAGGFLEIAAQPGFGPLDAALLVEAVAAVPVSAEVATTALIGPLIGRTDAPMALSWGLGRPARYLDRARLLCLFDGDDVLVGAPVHAVPVDSVVAYPLGVVHEPPADAERFTGATAAAIRRRARIGISAEAAGLLRGALDLTLAYVRERQQFGQPLGHFQAIQHRLAMDAQRVRACRALALRAAYSDDEAQAATACLYAQDAIREVIHDCHQFSGAMGLTLEYPLHLWTYRLKYLQGEAGGRVAQSRVVAETLWGEPLAA